MRSRLSTGATDAVASHSAAIPISRVQTDTSFRPKRGGGGRTGRDQRQQIQEGGQKEATGREAGRGRGEESG